VKHVKVYDVSRRVHGKVGRPKAVTKEELLHAIEMYATDSVRYWQRSFRCRGKRSMRGSKKFPERKSTEISSKLVRKSVEMQKRGEIAEDMSDGCVYAITVALCMGASFRCLRGLVCGSARRILGRLWG